MSAQNPQLSQFQSSSQQNSNKSNQQYQQNYNSKKNQKSLAQNQKKSFQQFEEDKQDYKGNFQDQQNWLDPNVKSANNKMKKNSKGNQGEYKNMIIDSSDENDSLVQSKKNNMNINANSNSNNNNNKNISRKDQEYQQQKQSQLEVGRNSKKSSKMQSIESDDESEQQISVNQQPQNNNKYKSNNNQQQQQRLVAPKNPPEQVPRNDQKRNMNKEQQYQEFQNNQKLQGKLNEQEKQKADEENESESNDEDLDAEDFVMKNCKFANDLSSSEERNFNDHNQNDQEESDNINRNNKDDHEERDEENEENSSYSSSSFAYHDEARDDDDADYNDESNQAEAFFSTRPHPVEFARIHMQKIEEDMHKMHERHVKLMREMDDNYRMIEQETQEYYLEFLQKWKEVAKSKIVQYRKAIEQLIQEKESIVKQKDTEIDAIAEKYTQAVKDNNLQQRQYLDQIDDMQSTINRQQEELILKENEKQNYKGKLGEKDNIISSLQNQLTYLSENMKKQELDLHNEIDAINQQYQSKIDELELEISKKSKDNLDSKQENSSLLQKIEQLEAKIKVQAQPSNVIKKINVTGLINKNNLIQKISANQNEGAGRNLSAASQINAQNVNINQNQVDSSSQPQITKVLNIKSFKKDQIQLPNKILKTQQQQLQSQSNYNTTNNNNNSNNMGILNNNQSLISNFQSTPSKVIVDWKAKEEEIVSQFQEQISKINQELAPIQIQVKQWCKEQQQQTGNQKPKIKDTDPFYPTYKRYKDLITEKNNLTEQKQKALQDLQTQQEQEQNQSANKQQNNQSQSKEEQKLNSARGSKSLSPRKNEQQKAVISPQGVVQSSQNQNSTNNTSNSQILSKLYNSAFSQMPFDEQIRILKSDIQMLLEEKEFLQRELKSTNEVQKLYDELNQLIQQNNFIDQNLRQEVAALRAKMGYKVSLDQQEFFEKLLNENNQLRDNLKEFENKYKKIVGTLKTQQMTINSLKQRIQSNPQMALSSGEQKIQNSMIIQQDQSLIMSEQINQQDELNSNVNQSRITDLSMICGGGNIVMNQEINIQQIEQQTEERVKKIMESQYNEAMEQLENKARQGMKQREERIEKLQKINLKLKQDLEEAKNNLALQANSNGTLSKELEKIKSGEELFIQQFNQLKLENEKIWSRYEYELVQRKQLHNIIEDMKGKIRVFCRVRPMNEQEKVKGHIPVVTIVDHFTVKLKSKENEQAIVRGGGYTESEFTYDACFGPRSTQEEVFEDTKMLLQSVFEGYNVCIFAYGQTGSGKTFTIQGSTESKGIVPRALQEMFNIQKRMERNDHFRINLECYMLELYCNNLQDLLFEMQPQQKFMQKEKPRLDIMEDPQTGMVYVQNLSKINLNSLNEALETYERGISNRKVFGTEMNSVSSRSHVIFSIVIETYNNDTHQRSIGKLSFVDLAGSERMDKSKPNVERLKEMNSINLSLKALGDVIQILSNGSSRAHIPYRNNKLTHLMKDSLGGNSKTLMFVNISPSDYDSQESKMSLYFGDRVKKIQNEAKKNSESEEVIKLKEENDFLRKQLAQNSTLRSAATGNNTMGIIDKSHNLKNHNITNNRQ